MATYVPAVLIAAQPLNSHFPVGGSPSGIGISYVSPIGVTTIARYVHIQAPPGTATATVGIAIWAGASGAAVSTLYENAGFPTTGGYPFPNTLFKRVNWVLNPTDLIYLYDNVGTPHTVGSLYGVTYS